MSYKEVTEMRKNGRLEESIQMAEADLEQESNYWTITALFWCLNDLYKTQVGEEKEQTVTRMCALAEQLESEDGFVIKCLERAKDSINPTTITISVASEQAKQGRALEAYTTLSEMYEGGELPEKSFNDYGWIIYRALHQNQQMNVMWRKKLLVRYLELGLSRPSLLHSLILSEAVNIEKSEHLKFLFSAFVNMWDLRNLRDDDWKQGETEDGQQYSSLVEKMITVYVEEMMITPTVTPSDDFIEVLEKAVGKWQKNVNILRSRARIYVKQKRIEEAIELYKQLVVKNVDKDYLCSELVEIEDDDEIKIALLCKALSTKNNEEFRGKMRMRLAELLIRKKLYGWALKELMKTRHTYEEMRWSVTPLENIMRKIPEGTQEEDTRTWYETYSSKAEEYLFSGEPATLMVKTKQRTDDVVNKKTGKTKKVVKWTLTDENGKVVGVRPSLFRLPMNLPNGSCFEVRMSDNRPVLVKSLDSVPDVAWIKKVSGPIQIKTNKAGKHFGFVENCYVHNDLLRDISDGDIVEGIAISNKDGWQCVLIN